MGTTPGTLNHHNQDPAEFHEGVFYLADRFDVPVVPITVIVSDRRILRHTLKRPFVQVTTQIGPPLWPGEFADGCTSRQAVRRMATQARREMAETIRAEG